MEQIFDLFHSERTTYSQKFLIEYNHLYYNSKFAYRKLEKNSPKITLKPSNKMLVITCNI